MTEEKRPVGRPKGSTSLAQQEMDKAQEQFEMFDENLKKMDMNYLAQAPLKEMEPQTKLAQKDLEKSKDLYLKPTKSISSREKFNENFRERYNFSKEYVQFIAEHKELIGESIEIWTKPFAGISAEFWTVPTNKPVWAPRYVAEQIHRKTYRRFTMENKTTETHGVGQFYGNMAVESTIQRLTAQPVSARKSIFMGV